MFFFCFFFLTMVIQSKWMKLFSDDACTYSSSYSACLVSMICVFIKFEPLEQIVVDIPFLLVADIRSSSPWPLLLASSSLQLLTISSNTSQAPSQLEGGTTRFFGFFWKRFLAFKSFIWVIDISLLFLCVQWFFRQANVPQSVSVSDVHPWRATAVLL